MSTLTLADGSKVEVRPNGDVSLISGTCRCCSRHAPKITSFDVHHIRPQSWGGQSVATNLMVVCPNLHRMTHLCLNEFVRAGGKPSGVVLAKYPLAARKLAFQGWGMRDPQKPTPMTLDHSAV